MHANSKQQAVTLEVDGKDGSSTLQLPALMSVVLGGILTVAAFSAGSMQAKPDFCTITVESLASVGEAAHSVAIPRQR